MTMRSVYAAFAVILPVALGLGLVYLASAERIDAGAAVFGALVVAAILAGVVWARDRGQSEDER